MSHSAVVRRSSVHEGHDPKSPRYKIIRRGVTLDDAGGANFPDKPPWEGGTKVWYDSVYVLNQPQGVWQELEPWPGPARMLAVTAAHAQSFFLMSGAEVRGDTEGKPIRRYLNDAYRYQRNQGWTRLADLPHPTVAAPSPAINFGRLSFLILGGDDGSLVDFKPLELHPGFPRSILAYHILTDSWQSIGVMPAAPVTTTITHWNQQFVMPTGEVRPGVRSPAVWALDQP